ncbi:unnamed protein product [Allacma fusca]|uniref:Elongation of very long chain fatty acids protein n=1 Tax=Allacma fusca TaxID=39272 RepID=A0A8J2KF33_9HEXA|nr:unnamed protein product [Allacma fusca]
METIFGPLAHQIPASLKDVRLLYEFAMSHADHRVDDWSLMGSPIYVIGIIASYLITVIFCKKIIVKMFYSIKVVQYLHPYNMILLVANAIMGTMFLWHIYQVGYNWRCQPVRVHGYHELNIAQLMWYFFISKIVELMDTFWLILKKKGAPLTFLQVYHHSTIVFACWIGARFVPGGSSALIALVNCWVHVLMYTYFKLKSMGMREIVSYKKFVTIMQMLQFLATIIHCITAMNADCNYPLFILFWLMLYMMTFVILFTHFYCNTYHPSVRSKAESKIKVKKLK